MEMASSHGPMELFIKGNLQIIVSQAKGSILGLTAAGIKDKLKMD